MIEQLFDVVDYLSFKHKLLVWGNLSNSFLFLDNHQYPSTWQQHELLVAVGSIDAFKANAGQNALQQMNEFLTKHAGQWIFGHLGYELKNEIEPDLQASPPDDIGFGDTGFFVPETVLAVTLTHVTITCNTPTQSPTAVWNAIQAINLPNHTKLPQVHFTPAHSQQAYLHSIQDIRKHIQLGHCYELNFCQYYKAIVPKLNVTSVYQALAAASPNPFGAFYKLNNSYLLCASPERYLLKKGNTICSQPIKGTAKRNTNNAAQDEQLRLQLRNSPKEQAENVMVVDLVRNDLSKVCIHGTVKVEELFGIYSYPQVHQMVSTIVGQLQPNISFANIVQASFPMGSMTGAPKLRVMQLIHQYEQQHRGLYAGSVGYIAPNGNFDFNVVIRSLLYNQASGLLKYAVGGGITWQSQPQQEWEECLLKAKAIRQLFN